MTKSIIIIGAGIAGLTAGCYARMNGYETTIVEQHSLPGGLCTSWSRSGYTFDYSIAYLMGVAPGSDLYTMWTELGALEGRQIHYFDEFCRVRGAEGKELIGYTDPDRLERHMLDLAPGDAKLIREFTGAIRALARHPIDPPSKPAELMSLGERFRQIMQYIPLGKVVSRFGSVTTDEFAREFKDPFLRQVFPRIFTWPDVPMLGVTMTLASLHARTSGRPSGGCLSFALAIERRYRSLGGTILYRAPVTKVLVENDRAVGVRLEDGRELRADMVISAADGRRTLYELLDGKYVTDAIAAYYRETPIYRPVVQVSLGVACDLSGTPASTVYFSDRPQIDAAEHPRVVAIKHFCVDPDLAPAGKSTVVVEYTGDYTYWQELHADRERYAAEKEQVAAGAIALLEKIHPGLSTQVEAVDVATPVTAERYTGNWQGSPMGFNPKMTLKSSAAMQNGGLTRTLPGLAQFYMVGQWAPMGGVPAVATWARSLIQLICHRDRRPFSAQSAVSR